MIRLLWFDMGWLLVLLLGFVLLRRELAILALRFELYPGAVPDGLDIGFVAPRSTGTSDTRLFLFVFGDCGVCHELVRQLVKFDNPRVLTVIAQDGTIPDGAISLVSQLPQEVEAYSGTRAEDVANAFWVHSGPFAIAVRNRVVVAKGYLRNLEDVKRFGMAVPKGA